MKLKLAIFTLYALIVAMPAMLVAQSPAAQRDCEEKLKMCDDKGGKVIPLDCNGRRGFVCFNHKAHESHSNPNSDFAHQAVKGAECAGCHHKRNEATGAPILAKCSVCHRSQGATDPENPKNRDMDEVWSERAYHDLCIGCHRASNEKGISKTKAPVACSECHASKTDASGKPVGLVSSFWFLVSGF